LRAHKPRNASDELEQVEASTSLFDLAADIFTANQKYRDAETLYRKVVILREKYAQEELPSKPNNEDFLRFLAQQSSSAQAKVVDAYGKLANLYRVEKKFEEAEDLYQKSAAIREKEYGPNDPRVAKTLSDLAMCYSQEGQFQQAEPLYARVVAVLEFSSYKAEPQMATALENYALVLRKLGRADQAAPLLKRAKAIREASPPVQ
jgi:tetratricopeptide (TPR) repeat protein